MIRLPPTQIVLSPDDVEQAKHRSDLRRTAYATQSSPSPVDHSTVQSGPMSDQDDPPGRSSSGLPRRYPRVGIFAHPTGMTRANNRAEPYPTAPLPPVASRQSRQSRTRSDSLPRESSQLALFSASQHSSRPETSLIDQPSQAPLGTGLDGSLAHPSETRQSRNGSLIRHSLDSESGIYRDEQTPSMRGTPPSQVDELLPTPYDRFRRAPMGDISSESVINEIYLHQLDVPGNEQEDREEVEGSDEESHRGELRDFGPEHWTEDLHLEPPPVPEVHLGVDALRYAADGAMLTDMSGEATGATYSELDDATGAPEARRTASERRSFVRYGSPFASSPPEPSFATGSQPLPRSRPNSGAPRQSFHAANHHSSAPLTAQTPIPPVPSYSSEDSEETADGNPQLRPGGRNQRPRRPHLRGGSPGEHSYSEDDLDSDYDSVEEGGAMPYRCYLARRLQSSNTPVDLPSSPPLPICRTSSASESEYDLPLHSSPAHSPYLCPSSPQLPIPLPNVIASSPSIRIPDSYSSSPSDYHFNASILNPVDESIMDGLYRNPYRRRNPLRRSAFEAASSSSEDLRLPSPSPSPNAHPRTPRRTIQVYDDHLPASSQPQTPPRREVTPYNPAFTAPARVDGGSHRYTYVTPHSVRRARMRQRQRQDGHSGSPTFWASRGGDSDTDGEGENASVGVEAQRWARRVVSGLRGRIERRGRPWNGERSERGSRGVMETTPEREVVVGLGMDL